MRVREAAVAGMFYPQDADTLRRQVRDYLAAAEPERPSPKALIAPHAGYVYSGPVAASAYRALRALRERVSRVLLLGPAHRVYVRGLAASSAEFFRTPLGDVPLESETIRRMVEELPFVSYADEVHELEHSLEVHLPFLQETLSRFTVLPLAVGDARSEWVESVLEQQWGGCETLVVISSDLSHYHDYATAQRLDEATSDAIEHLQPELISAEQACGRIPICGLLRLARRRGLTVETVDLRNSGDTAGPHDQVVGYGAYLFYPPSAGIGHEDKNTLVDIARRSIEHGLEHDEALATRADDFTAELAAPGASFVTLKLDGGLRGCIGSLSAQRPLVVDVAENAFAAAFRDPRFPRLTAAEFERLSIEISKLSVPHPLRFATETELLEQLRPREDGLILCEGNRRATFLPSVWEQLDQPQEFLRRLKVKAGLPADYWSDTLRLQRYTTESWSG